VGDVSLLPRGGKDEKKQKVQGIAQGSR